jgi:trimeric autotransporter adhesin
MKRIWVGMSFVVMMLLCASLFVQAQQTVATNTNIVVPPLINFSGVLTDVNGKPLIGTVSVTFSLYSMQTGGAALWMESQNVQPDDTGHYAVMLGSTSSQGLPAEIFVSGEAHWLGVRVQGEEEQPRILLVSAPYALKAADAQTVGGLPPSAFVLAAPLSVSAVTATNSGSDTAEVSPATTSDVTTTGGAVGYLPLFNGAATIVDSVVFQSAASPFKIGINTATPATTLDVKGGGTIRGTLSLPPTAAATATAGKNSDPLKLTASAFNSSSSEAVTQNFQLQAEPAGNDSASPSATLNLLFGSGTATPSPTGLSIANNGQITFATGQTFPGTGTITGVTAGSDLTGGGSSGNVTLNLDTTKVPLLAAANTFTGNQTVNGNLSATGVVTGSSYQIGSNLFAFGSYGNGNAFLGFAGNTQTTGLGNTASGYWALEQNITGSNNTAIGYEALVNLSGSNNTALGSGAGELGNDQTSNNTFVGAYTGTGTINAVNNATAIGANAQVNESNALVLGSISGVNNATASTNVGIGTTTPQATLDVAGYNLETFIGNPDCVSAFAGIAFGTSGFNRCQNYSIVGDGSNTFVAAPTGSLVFRVNSNNTTAMTIASNGNISMSSELSIASNGNLIALNPADGNVLISGNLSVGGNVSKGSGDFKIDDPLDPANKYLYHSFVESPDMMNIYNGNVVTDKYGRATVVLPEYFAALNRDFRYQLTVIGQFAQAMVAKEIRHNRFMIKTNRPGVKVSWQVTGIRQDAYANAHRIPTEEEKPPQERGRYLHPELFGASQEQAVGYRPSLPSTAAARTQVAAAANGTE